MWFLLALVYSGKFLNWVGEIVGEDEYKIERQKNRKLRKRKEEE